MIAPRSEPRPRRHLGRILLVLFLGLCGLFLVVLALLPYVISLDRVKRQLVAQVETALQRQVEIGQVRVQILTGLGADLEQLTVYNPPGWQQPHFVKVGTLSLKVAFLPLLRRQIEVSRIILSDGDIFIERDAQGRMNYADLTQPGAQDGQPPPAEVSPLAALLVSKVSLQDVNVTFIDRLVVPGQTYTTTARDVQGDITHIALNTPIDFDLSTALLTTDGRNVRLHGRLGPIPESLALDHTPLNVSLQAKDVLLDHLAPYLGLDPARTAGRLGADVTMQGTLGGSLGINGTLSLAQGVLPDPTGKGTAITLPTVTLTQDITLDLAHALLQLAEVRLDAAPLQATLKGTVRTFTTTPQLDVQLATNDFAPSAVLTQLPMLAAALPTPAEVQGRLQLQATAKGTPKDLHAETRLTIDTLSLRSGVFSGAKAGGGTHFDTAKTEATLQAHLTPPRPPDVRLDLRAERLLFDQQKTAAASPPQETPPAPVSKPAVPLPNLHGHVAIAEGRVQRLQFQQMTADLSLIDGRLNSTQTFRLHGGTFQGQLQANLTQTEPDYTFAMALANVNAGSLINELTSAQSALLGTLNTDLKGSGRGMTWPALNQTLTGTGKVLVTNLTLPTLDLMPKLMPGLQEVGKLAGFSLPADLSAHSFNTLQATFRIAQGQIRTDDLKLLGHDAEVQAKGVLGFDQRLDFTGTAFLLGPLAASLGPGAAFLRDAAGRVRLPFAVRGTVTQPQVVPDEAYLLELAQKSLLGKVEEKVGTELQKRLQKALPGKPPEPEPTKPGREREETPQERLEKTLRGLFKR